MHLQYLGKGDFEPFWGNSTSSVNWCEVDYEYTSYVAELFNSLSSICIILAGLMGSLLHKDWIELPFHASFLTTTMVGLGSIAFHATLKKSTQALDEVPMLFSAMSYLYVSILLHFDLGKLTKQVLGWLLLIHACITSFAVMYLDGQLQFLIFHLSFGTAEVASLISCVILYFQTSSQLSRKAFQYGISSYALAVFVWQFEIHYCPYLNPYYPESILDFNPQLHTIWHILVSVGLYLLALMMLNEKGIKDGKKTRVGWNSMGIPFIEIKFKSN